MGRPAVGGAGPGDGGDLRPPPGKGGQRRLFYRCRLVGPGTDRLLVPLLPPASKRPIMKRILFALLLIPVCGHAQTGATPLSGTWMGKIAGSLPIVFHFVSTPAGAASGSFDVPAP